MRTYLATLHRRAPAHKKRFALATSFCVTLLIFSIWSLVKFGPEKSEVIAERPNNSFTPDSVSPFESLGANISTSFQALKEQFSKAKVGLEAIDVKTEYSAVRNEALNNGQ